jgi:hypothetical protein
MSARGLGRLAGLIFALVVAFGGIGAVSVAQDNADTASATTISTLEAVWG